MFFLFFFGCVNWYVFVCRLAPPSTLPVEVLLLTSFIVGGGVGGGVGVGGECRCSWSSPSW